MFIEYFDKKPKYRYTCKPKKNFRHGVEITLWDNDHCIEMNIEDFVFPFHAWLIETYGNDPTRYEPIFDWECDVAFVYFRDREDQAAFKIIWGERVGDWDDKNDCYKEGGIRVGDILHLG